MVPLDCAIGHAFLTPGYVIPAVPVFHIIAKGTPFHKDFIAKNNPFVLQLSS